MPFPLRYAALAQLRRQDGSWHCYRMNGWRVLRGSGRARLTRDRAWRIADIADFNRDVKDDVRSARRAWRPADLRQGFGGLRVAKTLEDRGE